MSRSYKKNWISRNNMKYGKIASNRILRRIPILDRNGEDETILSGKNKRHRRGAGINPYDISDYVTWYKCSFTHRREDFPKEYFRDYYLTRYWPVKEVVEEGYYLSKNTQKRYYLDFYWVDHPKDIEYVPPKKRIAYWASHTYSNKSHRDLFYRMWMK